MSIKTELKCALEASQFSDEEQKLFLWLFQNVPEVRQNIESHNNLSSGLLASMGQLVQTLMRVERGRPRR